MPIKCTARAFVEAYATWVCKLRYVIILLWIVLTGASAVFIMKFVNETTQQFAPPDGTQAANAKDAFLLDFPSTNDISYVNVFIQLSGAADLVGVNASVITNPFVFEFVMSISEAFEVEFTTAISTLANYYVLRAAGMTLAADHLISPDNRSMALPLALKANFISKAAEKYSSTMVKIVANQSHLLGGTATAVCNGIPVFVKGIVEDAQTELGTMDAVAIPLAMVIMSLTLKSIRMMVLPLLTIGISLSTSFGAMYFVSMSFPASSTTPSLMMSLCIAMSIDYNLFILTRYKEELHKGSRGIDCISTVLRTAGHTILVSGVTLLVCLLSLVFFPINMLQSLGIGCAFTISMALLVTLTFAPALLLALPTFFEGSVKATEFPGWVPLSVVNYFNSGGYSVDFSDTSPITTSRIDVGPSYSNFTPRRDTAFDDGGLSARTLLTTNAGATGPRISGTPTVQSRTPSNELQPEKQRLLPPSNLSLPLHDENDSGQLHASYGEASGTPAAKTNATTTSVEAQYMHRTRSVFHKLGWTLVFPANAIVFSLIVGCVLALGYNVLQFKTTDSFLSYLPRNSDTSDNFITFVDAFGFGYTTPYHILLSGRNGIPPSERQSIPNATSEAFFLYFQSFLRRIVADTSVAPAAVTEFFGPLTLGSAWLNYSTLQGCLVSPLSCDPNVLGVLTPPNNMISSNASAMYVIYSSSFDPMGNLGDPYYKRLMALANEHQTDVVTHPETYIAGTPVTAAEIVAVASFYVLYFSGVGPDSMDAIDTVYHLFPIIVGVSAAAVLVVVGASFRSFVMPLRSIVSIGATQLFVFGLIVLTYQSPGILDWTTWGSVGSFGAVSWSAPVVAFSVVVGVALDYDIFLLTRVIELISEEGLSTREAVLHALCSTGKVITSAGVIMAVAFFGLLLSATQILNLLGFFMVAAVLFDTFVVRTLLVPTLMSMLGRWNWFPRSIDTHAD